MKAITQRRYGGTEALELREVERPEPGPDQVLVKMRAASVNPLDWYFMTGVPFVLRFQAGLRTPKRTTPGADLAGIVEAVGSDVTRFRPGDDVFGETSGGALAEYVVADEDDLVVKPPSLTFEQAAAVPVAGFTALQGLRDHAKVEPGQHVLVNGAAGGVGTFAVQIGKQLGAEVTGVCSTGNVEMVRSLGADHVVDYTADDFASGEVQYDVLFDCAGNRSARECKRALKQSGTYVAVGAPRGGGLLGPLKPLVGKMVAFTLAKQRLAFFTATPAVDDLEHLTELLDAGRIRPVIDRTYALDDAIEAIGYWSGGHARGKVVVTA
ncbi:NAD(P)-dependent alcohol dehydrogenase [Ilumatobacter sp.]|uniref:NAD(P)-dependent alcohol dehydrogenase n=1 Tax=Ilumatobacter sp. TaxID=1967498 RepID=UPI00345D28C0